VVSFLLITFFRISYRKINCEKEKISLQLFDPPRTPNSANTRNPVQTIELDTVIGEAHINTIQNLLLGGFCIILTSFGIRIGEGMVCGRETTEQVGFVCLSHQETSGKII
jgi:hypothetical protein